MLADNLDHLDKSKSLSKGKLLSWNNDNDVS
jgi:hypothetical protein